MLRKLFSKKPARKPSRPAFRPTLEGLEERAVPAAGVTTSYSLGALFITGDAGDSLNDRITISTDDAGNVVVSGDGTTVDGVASKTFSGFGLSFMYVNTGAGNDHVIVDNVRFAGWFVSDVATFINTGDGNDQVDLSNVSASGTQTNLISIRTGSGNDVINVDMASAMGGLFGGDIIINAGDGNDQVTISNLTVGGGLIPIGGSLTVDGGNGVDVLHDNGGNTVAVGIYFSNFEQEL